MNSNTISGSGPEKEDDLCASSEDDEYLTSWIEDDSESDDDGKIRTCYMDLDYPDGYERHLRVMQRASASGFRHSRYHGPEKENRTCIWPGATNFSWKENTSGVSWISVNGIGTICAVSMDLHPDERARLSRLYGRDQLPTGPVLSTAIADMADESAAFRQTMMSQSSKTGPFAVVSVASDTYMVSHKHCVEAAINFLGEKLKGRTSLTFKETEQIAICALKYLFGSKFKSDEIKRYGFGRWSGMQGVITAREVEEHLNAINQTTATGDLPTSLSSLSVTSTG